MDDRQLAPDLPKATAPTTRRRAPRGSRAAGNADDPVALIRGVVAKVQAQGAAEAERLRDAVRKAIATLQSALES